MATVFLKRGNQFQVTSSDALDMQECLPVGTYTVCRDAFNNFYLQAIDGFSVPGRIYGTQTSDAERIMSTFLDRGRSTGVMLAGSKGSGKTMLAKLLSSIGASMGISTITVNADYAGDEFNAFVGMISQPAIVLFDEFEKVFKEESQEKVLTLLDGVYGGKKLYVFTCNNKWKVDSNLRNRPGRVYYLLEYEGVDQEFVQEYCVDNLADQSQIGKVAAMATLFEEFNFDMLQSVVEELNRYGGSLHELMRMLNAKPEAGNGGKFEFSLRVNGKEIETKDLNQDGIWVGNPLRESVNLGYVGDVGGERGFIPVWFDIADMVKVNVRDGHYVLVRRDGVSAELKREKVRKLDYAAALAW